MSRRTELGTAAAILLCTSALLPSCQRRTDSTLPVADSEADADTDTDSDVDRALTLQLDDVARYDDKTEAYYQDCGGIQYSYEDEALEQGAEAQGTLDCQTQTVDVWTFQAAAGEAIAVRVDTLSVKTAFDPALRINDPQGCTVVEADDNFPCTYPPPKWACPAALIEDSQPGSYQVVLLRWDCEAEAGEYEIAVGSVRDQRVNRR